MEFRNKTAFSFVNPLYYVRMAGATLRKGINTRIRRYFGSIIPLKIAKGYLHRVMLENT